MQKGQRTDEWQQHSSRPNREWRGKRRGWAQDAKCIRAQPGKRKGIQRNYTPYDGDGSFLAGPTERTLALRGKMDELFRKEHENNGVLKIDADTVITPTAFAPGYLDKEKEIIVGFQTDEPLKRACNPFGGMRMVHDACKAYGYTVSENVEKQFCQHRTHNDGVFSACRTPTAAAASSATTAVWRSTASTA